MPELDTLRGIAIVAVVLVHGIPRYYSTGQPQILSAALSAIQYGWLGVNLFFVLSGFLITGILLDSKPFGQYYRRFYVRRALRILPAYLLLMLLIVLAPRIGISERQISWSFVGLSLCYLSNLTNFFGVGLEYPLLWSLAVEEHFYLIWPVVVRRVTKRGLAWCSCAVLLGCPLLRLIAFASKHGQGIFYTWMVADGLACGSLLAILCRTLLVDRRSMKWFSAVSVSASMLLLGIGAPFGTLSPLRQPQLWGATIRDSLFNVLFAGMLATALLVGTSRWSRVVHRPVLQFLGKISYGLYLVHVLVFDVTRHFLTPAAMRFSGAWVDNDFRLTLLRFLVGATAATVLAYLSRRYFEERFLSLKDSFAPASTPVSLSAEGQTLAPTHAA